MTMRHSLVAIISIGLAITFLPQKEVLGQSIKINPDPIKFGNGCVYSIDPPITGVQKYDWEHKCTSPASTSFGPLTSNNNAPAQSTIEAKPGTYVIQCTVNLQPTQQVPNPQPIVLIRTVVVPKPDGYTITGTGVPTALGQNCTITFQITQGGNNAFYIDGFAQESITNFFIYDYFGGKTKQADSGWVPVDANDPLASRFAINGGDILDQKFYDDSNRNGYARRIDGSTLESLTQGIRIKFTYADGTIDYATLPSRNFTFTKSDNNNYQVN